MQSRTILFSGVNAIIEKYFGVIPQYVEFDGAVLIPDGLTFDCKDIARSVLANQPVLEEMFSESDIARRIESIVIDTVREGSCRTPDLIDGLCTRLESRDEWKLVLIPLQGIKLSEAITDIGPIRLRTMDDSAIDEALGLWRAAIDRTSNTAEQKASAKRVLGDDLEKALRGIVCVEVRVCADIGLAENVAIQRATLLLDLLRYGSSVLQSNPAIGFKGDALPGLYRRYILPLGTSDAINPNFITGPIGDLLLDRASLERMERIGVQKVAATIQHSPSQLETAIRTGIHWFSESRIQIKPEYEIVTLAIAIESALATTGGEGLGRNVLSEAVAVLLSDDDRERKALFNLTREALQQRGGIMHHGKRDLEWDRLHQYRSVVRRFLTAAIESTDRFQSTTDLLSWVKSRNSELTDQK